MGRRKSGSLTKVEVGRIEMAWHKAFCPVHDDDDCKPTPGDREDVAILIGAFNDILIERAGGALTDEISERVRQVKAECAAKRAAEAAMA